MHGSAGSAHAVAGFRGDAGERRRCRVFDPSERAGDRLDYRRTKILERRSIHCLKEAGFDTGSATYTGNLSDNLTRRGWTRLPANGNPQPGDILLNDVHHVAVYLGGGKLAQASISERGTAYGKAGDQTGRETNIRNYYNYPWNCYLRYQGAQSSAPAVNSGAIAVDGNVGPATVRRWQQVMGTAVDGIISGQQVPDGRTYARPAIDSSVVRYGAGGSDRSANTPPKPEKDTRCATASPTAHPPEGVASNARWTPMRGERPM